MLSLLLFIFVNSCVYNPSISLPPNQPVDSSSWGTPLKEIWKVKKLRIPV